MSRKSTIDRLPPLTKRAVIDWIRAGRHTLDEMEDFLKARGYQISRSALGRYKQALEGNTGVLIAWCEAHPEECARIAATLEANPDGGFTFTLKVPKARKGKSA